MKKNKNKTTSRIVPPRLSGEVIVTPKSFPNKDLSEGYKLADEKNMKMAFSTLSKKKSEGVLLTDKEKTQLRKQLIKLLRADAVDEAFEILTQCSEKWLKSFRKEMKKEGGKGGNTACLAIEFAKFQLVRDGKMKICHFSGNAEEYYLTPEDIAKL